LEITTNNLQNYTANLDTVGKALIYNSKQVQILIESNEEKMIEVLNSILDNSRKIFTSTQSLNQNITQVTTSLKDHIVQIDQQSKFLYNLTVTIQKADGNINQVSGKLEENTPLLDNQINKLQLLTSQLNQTTQVVYQVNGNLAGLLNASQKSQQSNN
jgi:methyl-accepting chemotaxis protein